MPLWVAHGTGTLHWDALGDSPQWRGTSPFRDLGSPRTGLSSAAYPGGLDFLCSFLDISFSSAWAVGLIWNGPGSPIPLAPQLYIYIYIYIYISYRKYTIFKQINNPLLLYFHYIITFFSRRMIFVYLPKNPICAICVSVLICLCFVDFFYRRNDHSGRFVSIISFSHLLSY